MTAMLLLLLSATPNEPLKLAMPDLQVVNIEAKEAAFYTEHLAQAMKYPEVSVVTAREMATFLGLERQRQLLGCDATSCITELAGALGADVVVMGDVARLGGGVQVNVKVLSATTGKTLATFSKRAANDAESLDVLSEGGHEVLLQTCHALQRPVPEGLLMARQPALVRHWWVPGAAGIAVAGVGAGLFLVAQGDYQTLAKASADAPLTREQASNALTRGKVLEPAGVGCLVAGGIGLAASITLFTIHRVSVSSDLGVVTFVPLPEGGTLVLGGTLP